MTVATATRIETTISLDTTRRVFIGLCPSFHCFFYSFKVENLFDMMLMAEVTMTVEEVAALGNAMYENVYGEEG